MRLFALMMLLFASLGFASNGMANPYADALPAWQQTLNDFVDDQGRIDFHALSKDTSSLDVFVDAVAKVSPRSNPDLFSTSEEVLSYHINAYNALAMRGVIERDIPDNFSSLLKRASFFKFRSVVIGGKKTNLYDYENKVIRPLGEARMHFVLNCMVVDCPPLLKKVYKPATLEADLQSATLAFFNNEKYVQINDAKQEVWLSRLLKFYTEDYVSSGKKRDLIGYVNQYREQAIPQNFKVKFLSYDWTVNQQPEPFASKVVLLEADANGA